MNKLKYLRIDKNLSMKDLGELAGVSQDTVCRIENNKNAEKVKLETYNKIAKALKVHTMDIIEDDLLV